MIDISYMPGWIKTIGRQVCKETLITLTSIYLNIGEHSSTSSQQRFKLQISLNYTIILENIASEELF